jgi:dTDP-4-dehydrorhamnose reductase
MTSPYNSKIAILGASSMVGSRFCEQTLHSLIKADLRGKNSVDITDRESMSSFFNTFKFDNVILFSAFTDVDEAEKQRDDKNAPCWQINVEGAKNVANACRQFSKTMVLISTNFVFDGQNGPYGEEDSREGELSKISWYGITKLKAEEEIEKITRDNLIIRITYPYRSKFEPKTDFARSIIKRYDENSLFPMFYDQTITPTFIDDLAPSIDLLIKKEAKGIFHVASPVATTPYEFAYELLSVFKRDPKKLQKGSIVEFLKKESNTPRPIKGGMKIDKITKLGFKPTNYIEGIKQIYLESSR